MTDNTDDDNGKVSNKVFSLVLTILSIIVILFSTGFYVIDRISEVEKAVEVECEIRKRIEIKIEKLDGKIDQVLDRLPEKRIEK